MPSKYKTLDGTWEEFVIQTGLRDLETYYQLIELSEKVAELEKLAAGLASFAGVQT